MSISMSARLSALTVRPQRARVLALRPQQQLAPVGANLDRFLDMVRDIREAEGKRSFMDMIEPQYRFAVIKMADEAFPEKGAGRSREQFGEDMALCWLANREAFRGISEECGFTKVDCISPMQPEAFLALTINGSVVGLTSLQNGMGREIHYCRITERVETDLPEFSQGHLCGEARVNDRLPTSIFSSSRVIALVKHPTALKEHLTRSIIEMRKTMNTNHTHTVWVRDNGNGDK